MKLKDLQTGMVVENRIGYKYLVVKFNENNIRYYTSEGFTYCTFDGMTNDLLMKNRELDIVKIYNHEGELIWERKENKNPFKSVKIDEDYFAVNSFGKVNRYFNFKEYIGENLNLIANYYADEDFAIKQAKEEVLNRLLKRFSYENGWTDDLWLNDDIPKFYIVYDTNRNQWLTRMTGGLKHLLMVHFTSDDVAQRAINEIIIPFYNNELEVCKIWE